MTGGTREAKRLPYRINEGKEMREMEDYKSMCKQIQDKVNQITEGRGFFAKYAITIDEPAGRTTREFSSIHVNVDFFDNVFKVAEKLRELLDKDETKAAQVERKDVYSIKSARDEALMYLYKRYNSLAALEEVDFAASVSMCDVLGAIEKLEHARHMEASDEIAKLLLEKLGDMAEPWPKVVSNITKEQVEKLRRDVCGKKGAKE